MDGARDIQVLDGGTGHELKKRGVVSDGSFLEGVLSNEQKPDTVSAVHRDFLGAGCRVVTTNSFVAVPDRIEASGICDANHRERNSSNCDRSTNRSEYVRRRTLEIVSASVACARRAVEAVRSECDGRPPVMLVAGCVPPLYECYVSHLVPQSITAIIPEYETLIRRLWNDGVDILLAETLSTVREALAVIAATRAVAAEQRAQNPCHKSPKLYISFTVHDDRTCRLRSGERLESAVQQCLEVVANASPNTKPSTPPLLASNNVTATSTGRRHENLQGDDEESIRIDAIGVNCSSPDAVACAVPLLKTTVEEVATALRLPIPRIVAYGNAFKTTTSEWLEQNRVLSAPHETRDRTALPPVENQNFDDEGCILPTVYCQYAQQWIRDGATIVGGCSGCSPKHMSEVCRRISEPQGRNLTVYS